VSRLSAARLAAAIGGARLAKGASRLLRRGGGSTMPGLVARRIAPACLRTLAARLPRGAVLVAGTNGKTTTSRMLAGILRQARLTAIHNREGANLLSGVTTTVATNSALSGRPHGDIGLFEVDEASLPAVVEQVAPQVVVLLNLFRDQLDRYGELDHLTALWRQGIFRRRTEPAAGSSGVAIGRGDGPTIVVNADDPGLATLGESAAHVLWYGIEDTARGTGILSHAADALFCTCGAPLVYDAVHYAHLGHWRCPSCGRRRPQPAIFATDLQFDGLDATRFRLHLPGGVLPASIPLPGLYNVGNAVAAAAAATALGLAPATIVAGLTRTRAAFGRLERVHVGGRDLVLWLVKNPAGFNEALRTLLAQAGGKTLVIAVNDRIADGQDVSWLWDVDFEVLAGEAARVDHIVCAGTRAHDLAVRLKYAGLPQARQSVRVDPLAAVQRGRELASADSPVFIFPTYTAMLELRAGFRKLGWVGQNWEN
jgi:lipid II isoglutaminyl synthase (glutamine-hydrolysing)